MQKLLSLITLLVLASCASPPPSPGDSGVLPLAEVSAFYDS